MQAQACQGADLDKERLRLGRGHEWGRRWEMNGGEPSGHHLHGVVLETL